MLGNSIQNRPWTVTFVPDGPPMWQAIVLIVSIVASLLPAQRARKLVSGRCCPPEQITASLNAQLAYDPIRATRSNTPVIHWKPSDIPDLADKIAIVTGANRGLGYEAARMLAENGAAVILAVRTPAKGEQAAAAIRQDTPGAALDVMPLDLSDLATVRAFAEAFQKNTAVSTF
jgi:hypothetical protein